MPPALHGSENGGKFKSSAGRQHSKPRSNPSSSSATSSLAGDILPHLPAHQQQPIHHAAQPLPQTTATQSLLEMSPVKSSPSSVKSPEMAATFNAQPPDELLKFDDAPSGVSAAAGAASGVSKSDYDFRYEFSETRKVLDEFFNKAEAEYPPSEASSSVKNEPGSKATPQAGNQGDSFSDLNYTLRRCSPVDSASVGSSYVGQRLAEESPGKLTSSKNSQEKISACAADQDLILMLEEDERAKRPDFMMKPAATTDGAAGSSGAQQQLQQLPGLSTMMVGHTRLNVSAFEPTRSPVEESLAPTTSEPGLPAISNNAYQGAAVSIAASHHATAPPASQLQASTSQISHTSSFPVMEPPQQQQTLSSSKLVMANSHGASGPVHQHHPPSQQGVPPAGMNKNAIIFYFTPKKWQE